jgi:hypothetical protein
MFLLEAPKVVAVLAAAVATSPSGEIAAVICARPFADLQPTMIVLDALAGSFSDFDGFCTSLFDRVDEIAADVQPMRRLATVFVDPDLFGRAGAYCRLDALGFKPPVNATVDCAFYPPTAEQDPARRALLLAASSSVALSPSMARKALVHPYDSLASYRYDPAAPSALADALGRAFDCLMVTNFERHKAQVRRGEPVR